MESDDNQEMTTQKLVNSFVLASLLGSCCVTRALCHPPSLAVANLFGHLESPQRLNILLIAHQATL